MDIIEVPDPHLPLLRFLQPGASDSYGGVLYECHWIGSWPPPEQFRVFIGKQSGIVKVFPANEPWDEDQLAAALHPSIELLVYGRHSYSRITDEEIATMTHVMRGAEYAQVKAG